MCRSRRELSNEYLLAKIGVDTAENEPLDVWGKNSIQYSLHSLGGARRDPRGGGVREEPLRAPPAREGGEGAAEAQRGVLRLQQGRDARALHAAERAVLRGAGPGGAERVAGVARGYVFSNSESERILL